MKETAKVLNELKQLVKDVDEGATKDETVMLVCTASIVAAINKLASTMYDQHVTVKKYEG